jgi:hypothetical protein
MAFVENGLYFDDLDGFSAVTYPIEHPALESVMWLVRLFLGMVDVTWGLKLQSR